MIDPAKRAQLVDELAHVINRHSLENGSDTPDFMLAEHLVRCLETYNATLAAREAWYGRTPSKT